MMPLRDRNRSNRRSFLAGFASLVLIAATPVVAGAEAASEFIQDVGARTVSILQRPGASRNDRVGELVALLDDVADFEVVGRLVLGQYWRQASEAQRQEYLRLFRDLVVKTMADRLNTYAGETFEITGSKSVDDRDSVVSTRILRLGTDAQPIAVDWRVRNTDGHLAIIDLVAEGISMIVTQRSEVTSVVSQKGMDGLIDTMRLRLKQPAPK
jgi:phospholipid transport system substrate-binding protein